MAVEYFVSIAKPDALARGLVGDILHRFEQRGLVLIDLKWLRLTEAQIRAFYADKATEPFFAELLAFLLSGPVVASVWSGEEAIEKGRQVVGEKDPLKSEIGSIRGGMAEDKIHSLVHGSRSAVEAQAEMQILFPERWPGPVVPAADRPADDAPKDLAGTAALLSRWWEGSETVELEARW